MEGRYNTRSPAVKRLMREAQELSEPTDQYFTQPLEDNLFEWHFTVRGPADSDFQNGIYHGRIILPVDYPMKPPSIIWLTPNGRFETNKKICLSISGHHPESWQPSWSIRTALLAIIGFMPTRPGGAIGSLDYKPEERKLLAKKSREWKCSSCADIKSILLEPGAESNNTSDEARELASQINFQGEKSKDKEDECPIEAAASGTCSTTISVASSESSTIISQCIQTKVATSIEQANVSHQPPTYPGQFMPWAHPSGMIPPPTGLVVPPIGALAHHPWTPQATGTGSVAAMMPRFPYPPSHYSTKYMSPFYPPGFALPPGLGLFPCPYPPCQTPATPVSSQISAPVTGGTSVNIPNSVTGGTPVYSPSSAPTHSDSNQTSTSVSCFSSTATTRYTRTPMTTPKPTPRPPYVNSSEVTVYQRRKSELSQSENQAKSDMMNELKTKVKRVDSDNMSTLVLEEEGAVGGAPITVDHALPAIGDSESVRIIALKAADSISEISLSFKRDSVMDMTEANNSGLDADENSDTDAPPIEISDTDNRSGLERSNSGSTSDLERRIHRQGTTKAGLRQRQSATARIPSDVYEDRNDHVQTLFRGGLSHGTSQRIEAASGDTRPRNRDHLNQAVTRIAVQQNYQGVLNEIRERNSPYDLTFFVMVLLSIATGIILFNRVAQKIDWEELYDSEYFN